MLSFSSLSTDCAVCMDSLATNDSSSLPCGHNVCTKCMRQMLDEGQEACPLCNVNSDQIEGEVQSSSVFHQSDTATNQTSDTSSAAAVMNGAVCSLHCDIVCELFCTSCDALICSKCVPAHSKFSHIIVNVEDEIAKHTAQFTYLTDTLKLSQDRIEVWKCQQLCGVEEGVESVRQKVEHEFEQLSSLLSGMKEQVIRRIDIERTQAIAQISAEFDGAARNIVETSNMLNCTLRSVDVLQVRIDALHLHESVIQIEDCASRIGARRYKSAIPQLFSDQISQIGSLIREMCKNVDESQYPFLHLLTTYPVTTDNHAQATPNSTPTRLSSPNRISVVSDTKSLQHAISLLPTKTIKTSDSLLASGSVSGDRSDIENGAIFCIGGGTRLVEAYSFASRKWLRVAEITTQRWFPSCAALNGQLYVLGNEAIEQYDPAVDNWSPVSAMNVPRILSGMVALADAIYVFGGKPSMMNKMILDSTERYDSSSNSWSSTDSLNCARYAFAATVLENRMYAIGGIGGSNMKLSSCECAGPDSPWRPVASLNIARSFAAAAACAGSLYVFGGETLDEKRCASIEQYDLISARWTILEAKLRTARAMLGAVAVSDSIYVVAGSTGIFSSSDKVDQFDTRLQKFVHELSPLSSSRGFVAVSFCEVPTCWLNQLEQKTIRR